VLVCVITGIPAGECSCASNTATRQQKPSARLLTGGIARSGYPFAITITLPIATIGSGTGAQWAQPVLRHGTQ
jgi:hypothetical protein